MLELSNREEHLDLSGRLKGLRRSVHGERDLN